MWKGRAFKPQNLNIRGLGDMQSTLCRRRCPIADLRLFLCGIGSFIEHWSLLLDFTQGLAHRGPLMTKSLPLGIESAPLPVHDVLLLPSNRGIVESRAKGRSSRPEQAPLHVKVSLFKESGGLIVAPGCLMIFIALGLFAISRLSDCSNENFRLWFSVLILSETAGAIGVYWLLNWLG